MKGLVFYSLFFLIGILTFAQTKQDTFRHLSIGVNAGLITSWFSHFPDYPNNGLPLSDESIQEKSNTTGPFGTSLGFIAAYRLSKRCNILIGKFNSNFSYDNFSLGLHHSDANVIYEDSNSIMVNRYNLKYYEIPLLFKYYYKIKRKRNAYFSVGVINGFLKYEKIEIYDTSRRWKTLENKNIRFNRILPDFSIGCDYFLSKTVSIYWKCNFDMRPIYLKDNAFVKETNYEFRINVGLNLNFIN